MRRIVLTLVAWLLLGSPAMAWERELRVPLREGQLHLNDLTGDWQQALRLDRLIDTECLDATVDLRGLRGAVLVRAMNAALDQGCTLSVEDNQLVLHINSEHLPRSGRQTRQAVRTFTAVVAPDATAAQAAMYGLTLPDNYNQDRPLVVLVHGLDGAQANCTPLGAMLNESGFQVGYFTYPSDQPLMDSAALLAREVERLRESAPEADIKFVGHSMGGLVARAFVEGDAYQGGVSELIMIAPPNHGSKLARFRLGLELEEHYVLWKHDPNWHWSWMITDGLGEAGADLSVDSTFLSELNERPRRAGVAYTIVAGSQHPVARMTGQCIAKTAAIIPGAARDWWGVGRVYQTIDGWGEAMRNRACSGDGAVSVTSTHLAGVQDVVVVSADHASLYLPTPSTPAPPSWPVIVDRLQQ